MSDLRVRVTLIVVALLLIIPLTAAQRSKDPQLVAPAGAVSGAPITLDAQQSQEVAVLVDFIRAYNAGNVSTALSLFGPNYGWSGCDYAHGTTIAGRDKASLARWLEQSARHHDNLEIRGVGVQSAQEDVLAVTWGRRESDTLRTLGHPRGITSLQMSKVILAYRGPQSRPMITTFANGPFGGDQGACRVSH